MLTACESVKFQQKELYDVYLLPEAKEKISSQTIYEEGTGTMWNSLFNCGNFEITKKVAYSGNSSIKLSWNKANCEWIGFGNSYNNWQPVDLTEDIHSKALSFYVRTQEKTAGAIPIVANLEDFSGGGSYFFIDANKYLYGLQMDTTWKRIVVPLWHFPLDEEEVDISAIKQVKFQLEGAGSFYLDEIKIVDYSKEEYQKMRADVEEMKPKGSPAQIVYTRGKLKEDAWGYENNDCQTLEEIVTKTGQNQIHWKYNSSDCSWAKWGINWNGWYAMNLRGVEEQSKLLFKIKPKPGSEFKVMLQDFKGHSAQIFNHKTVALDLGNGWKSVIIDIKSLELKKKNFALDQIKQLYFEGQSEGEVIINEIKIIK